MDELIHQRIESLKQNISRILALLDDYERLLILEENPKKIMRYKEAVSELRIQRATLSQEYQLLNQQITHSPQRKLLEVESTRLQQIDTKMDRILHEQRKISKDFQELKAQILTHYSAREAQFMDEVITKLEYQDAKTVDILLSAIEENRLRESHIILASIEHGITSLANNTFANFETRMKFAGKQQDWRKN